VLPPVVHRVDSTVLSLVLCCLCLVAQEYKEDGDKPGMTREEAVQLGLKVLSKTMDRYYSYSREAGARPAHPGRGLGGCQVSPHLVASHVSHVTRHRI